jgi:hypothetical protein
MTIQCTKASSLWRIQGPFSALRLALKGYLGSQEGQQELVVSGDFIFN